MAIKLNTSKNESHEEILKRKNRRVTRNFKYVMYGLIGITVLICAIQIIRIIGKSIEVKKNEAFYNGYVDEYHALQAKYGVSGNSTEEVATEGDATEGDAEDPAIIIDTLYDATTIGNTIAGLETEYTTKGMLLNADQDELTSHVSDNSNWLESKISDRISVEWVFETQYSIDGGGQNEANININNCVWCCYHTAPSGTKYPLMYVIADYNVNGQYFTVNEKYITDFGRMYKTEGMIEKKNDEIMPEAEDAQEISDFLRDNEGGDNTQELDYDESDENNETDEVIDEETTENTENKDTDGGN